MLLLEAMRALHMTTREVAEALGFSERTGQRWFARESSLSPLTLAELARLVHPANQELATEIAASAGRTLEALGLVPPPGATRAHEPPSPSLQPPVPPEALADAVVCAAARAANLPPDAQRPAVVAAFERARALRMTVEQVLDVLAASGAPASG